MPVKYLSAVQVLYAFYHYYFGPYHLLGAATL